MSFNILSAALLQPVHSFSFPAKVLQKATTSASCRSSSFKSTIARFMSTDSNNSLIAPSNINISRLSTLQTLLQKAGASGSRGCNEPNDLEPVSTLNLDLHPHLFPIAQSSSKPDHYICGLRRAYADDAMYESSTNAPWPIVEATTNGMGYNLLSLNSEHIMRRIVAQADSDRDENKESDASGTADELVGI